MNPHFFVTIEEDQRDNSYPEANLYNEERFLVGTNHIAPFLYDVSTLLEQENGCLTLVLRLENLTKDIVFAIASLCRDIKERIKPTWYPRFDLQLDTKYFKIDEELLSETVKKQCSAFQVNDPELPCRYYSQSEFHYRPSKYYPNTKEVVGHLGMSGYLPEDFELEMIHGRYINLRQALQEISWHNRITIRDDQDYQKVREFVGLEPSVEHHIAFF